MPCLSKCCNIVANTCLPRVLMCPFFALPQHSGDEEREEPGCRSISQGKGESRILRTGQTASPAGCHYLSIRYNELSERTFFRASASCPSLVNADRAADLIDARLSRIQVQSGSDAVSSSPFFPLTDKASIIRLTISYLKLRDFTQNGEPTWNLPGLNSMKNAKICKPST